MILPLRVRLVSPALIGGANPRTCDDPPTLRVPELRGLFRFWTRALGGAGFRRLEETMWGSTTVGQRVSIRVAVCRPPQPRSADLFPHKQTPRERTRTDMIAAGCEFDLFFSIPHLGPLYFQQLQAVVWTALHLGAVGRRSRRGYGSMQWLPERGDLFDGFLETRPPERAEFPTTIELSSYLVAALSRVNAALGQPDVGPAAATRASSDWFQLTSIDQVFVGGELRAAYDGRRGGMEELIHGCGTRSDGGVLLSQAELNQMGTIQGGRLASPMLWRIYRLISGAFVPVMTWSPREGVVRLTSGSPMHTYLTAKTKLGFSNSLAGNAL